MDLTTYTFILNLIKLIIPILLVILGFFLILKKVNGNSGEISLGSLSIKNSTAGIVLICCGTLLTTFAINKGNGYEIKRKYEDEPVLLSSSDSATKARLYSEEIRLYKKEMPDSIRRESNRLQDSMLRSWGEKGIDSVDW